MVADKNKASSPKVLRSTSSRTRGPSPGRNKAKVAPTPAASSTPVPFVLRSRSPIKSKGRADVVSPVTASPRKSPSRKSPKRQSPSRQSPSRRSPLRRSPSRRVKKSPKRYDEGDYKVLSYQGKTIELDTDSDGADVVNTESKEKPKARVRGRRRLDEDLETFKIAQVKLNEVIIPLRRTTRMASKDAERVVHVKHFDNLTKKGEFSDEDDLLLQQQQLQEIRKSKSVEKKLDKPENFSEFGGWIGALFLMLSTLVSLLYLHFFCNELNCSWTVPPSFSKLTRFSTYFHLNSFLYYTVYCSLLAVLSSIPFGGRKVTGLPNKQGRLTYTMNGVFSFVVLLSILIGLEIKGYDPADFIIGHLFHLMIAAIIIGLYISTHAFIRSYFVPVIQLNPHSTGKNAIYNYFMGRELNPRVFGVLDLKMYVFRLSIIGSLLLDFIVLYKSMGGLNIVYDYKSITIHPTLLTLVLLRAIYHLDGLINESAWVTSFEIQYEGFGFMGGLGYSIWPFMTVSITKYLLDFGVHLETWKLVSVIVVFIVGSILFRGSNNQKDAFRKNPYSPAFSNMETIPTSQGRKLLASGFWGIVRHPNYLGDILMNLSFLPFAPFVPPVLTVLTIVVLLVHRSVRDNTRCKLKYGTSWERYCSKVKYILIPKVY